MIRVLYRFSITIIILCSTYSHVRGEPWSEKLGFPPGRRVVILDAREMGVAWEINEATKELLTSGHVSSAGIVVTGPRFNDVAKWSRDNSGYDLGVSVALTNPYETLSWRLLTSEQGPTTLVDADGFPWKTVVQLAVSANAEDVKAELDAQIDRARKAGIKPTHICGYYGTALSRPDLAAVILGAARKYWLPAPVIELTPELVERFRQQGFPINEEMAELISDYPLPKLDDLRMSPPGESYEDKRDRFCELINTLLPGLTQVILRPAVESKGLKLLTADWQQRVWDADLLRDEKVMTAMKEQSVLVTDWREVMRRFESGPSIPTDAATVSTEEDSK